MSFNTGREFIRKTEKEYFTKVSTDRTSEFKLKEVRFSLVTQKKFFTGRVW